MPAKKPASTPKADAKKGDAKASATGAKTAAAPAEVEVRRPGRFALCCRRIDAAAALVPARLATMPAPRRAAPRRAARLRFGLSIDDFSSPTVALFV